MKRIIAAFIFFSLLVCPLIGDTQAGEQYAMNKKHYDESLFKVTDRGYFSVEMLVKSGDLKEGKSRIDIIIHDSNDFDLEGGVVEAAIWTPEEGVIQGGKLPVSEIRGGRYRIKEIEPREGNWGLHIKIRKEGVIRSEDVVDSVVFDLSSLNH